MKSFLATTVFCFLSLWAFSQNVTQTIHQAITATETQQVILQLDGEVEIRETKGTRVLLESTVLLNVPNTALLDYLIGSGRYAIAQTIDEAAGTMTLTSKKRTNAVMVKGAECREEIKHVVYIPTHIRFTQDLSATASANK